MFVGAESASLCQAFCSILPCSAYHGCTCRHLSLKNMLSNLHALTLEVLQFAEQHSLKRVNEAETEKTLRIDHYATRRLTNRIVLTSNSVTFLCQIPP
jgi:hypothetical protein